MAGNNRSINMLIDQESENEEIIQASSVLDDVNEGVAMRMREALVLAQRSGIYKYVCAICRQPLSLRRRSSYEGLCETWFFSHFPNSNPCPIKTELHPTPSSYAEYIIKRFQESDLHKMMMHNIKKVLEADSRYADTVFKKRICHPEITKEFRVPDVYTKYGDKNLAFDFQLFNTFIDVIADRNAFFRLIGSYLIWLFPYFTTGNQKLHEKDIYYSHKRNVFVFDCEQFYKPSPAGGKCIPFPQYPDYKCAYEESMARGTLCINCFWQDPVVENGTIKAHWNHKLVTLDQLTFDNQTKDVYYIDSDKLFYDKADEKTRLLLDEWKAAKEERWNEIFDSIENGYSIGIIKDPSKITPFQDESTRLWGFRYEGTILVPARYTEAMPLTASGRAFVRKTRHWGIIDMSGHRMHRFNIKDVSKVEEGGGYIADGHYFDERLHELITDEHTRYAVSDHFIEGERYSWKNYRSICSENSLYGFVPSKFPASDLYDKTGKLITTRCLAYKILDEGYLIAICEDHIEVFDREHRMLASRKCDKLDLAGSIIICGTQNGYGNGYTMEYALLSLHGDLLSTEKFPKYEIGEDGALYVQYLGCMHPFIEGKGIMPIRERLAEGVFSLRMGDTYRLEINGQESEATYCSISKLDNGLVEVVEPENKWHGLLTAWGNCILPCTCSRILVVRCKVDNQGCLLLNEDTPDLVIFAQKPDDENWHVYSSMGTLLRSDLFLALDTNEDKVKVHLEPFDPGYTYSLHDGVLPIRERISDEVFALEMQGRYALEVGGEQRSEYLYSEIKSIGHGLVMTTRETDQLHSLLDEQGSLIIPVRFDSITTLERDTSSLEHIPEALAADSQVVILLIHIPGGTNWQVYTSNGYFLREDHHEGVIVEDGKLFVRFGDDTYPYSETQGILPIKDEIHEGLWANKLCGKYALTYNGHTTGYIFNEVRNEEKSRCVRVAKMTEGQRLFGIYSYECTQLLPCAFAKIYYLKNGGFAVQDCGSGNWGAFDQGGKLVIPCEYDSIKFSPETGFYIVTKEGKCKLIDRRNHEIICYPDGLVAFHIQSDGTAFVRNSQNKSGICNAQGNLVVEAKYDQVSSLGNGRFVLLDKKSTTTKVKEKEKSPWGGKIYYKTVTRMQTIMIYHIASIHDNEVQITDTTKEEVERLVFAEKYTIGQKTTAKVISKKAFGMFVCFPDGQISLLPVKYLHRLGIDMQQVPVGQTYNVTINKIIPEEKRVFISLSDEQ